MSLGETLTLRLLGRGEKSGWGRLILMIDVGCVLI